VEQPEKEQKHGQRNGMQTLGQKCYSIHRNWEHLYKARHSIFQVFFHACSNQGTLRFSFYPYKCPFWLTSSSIIFWFSYFSLSFTDLLVRNRRSTKSVCALTSQLNCLYTLFMGAMQMLKGSV